MQLSDLYDADLRIRSAEVSSVAASMDAPHPIDGVRYFDGVAKVRYLTYPGDKTDWIGRVLPHPISGEPFVVHDVWRVSMDCSRLTLVTYA